MWASRTPPIATSRRGRARTPPSPTHGPMIQTWHVYSPRRSARNVGNPYSTGNFIPMGPTLPPLQSTAEKPQFVLKSPPKSPPPYSGDNRDLFTLQYHGDTLLDGDKKKSIMFNVGANELPDPFTEPTTLLPTPNETPHKMTPARKHNRNTSIEQAARILAFPSSDPNDLMPERRNRYKYSAMHASRKSLLDLDDADDFSGPDGNANPSFEIYTESHARVPERDASNDNPFYRDRAATAPPDDTTAPGDWTPPRRPRKSAAQLKDEEEMRKAVARGEGMIYMFRGRQVYVEYQDTQELRESLSDSGVDPHGLEESIGHRSLKRAIGASIERPLTRSSIKPRLLFPANTPQSDDVDEEAETDVEMSEAPLEKAQVAAAASNSIAFTVPGTPAETKAPVTLMMSPPVTTHSSRKRNADEVPIFQDNVAESTPAKVLPTPRRSSKKKRVNFDIPAFESEYAAGAEDDSAQPTPQRSGRKKAPRQLSPGIAHVAGLTGSASSDGRSNSPFDQWPRIKNAKGESAEGSTTRAAAKRTRRSTASYGA